MIKNDLGIRLDTPYGRYISKPEYSLSLDIVFEKEEANTIILDNDILQISFVSKTEEKRTDLINFINENISQTIKIEDIFKTGKNREFFAINIVNKNVSKGNAINGLCKFLKIDPKNVIAIGNGINDISMIKLVGLGVAMENGEPEAKSAAKEITTTNIENGVAKILKEKF